MKKSKLSITLVTSFIAAMAMSACNSVTSSKKAVVTFTPYGSKESIDIITDDVYNAYRDTTAGVTKFYEKILEVLIRYHFEHNDFSEGELKYSQIKTWAKNQVQEQKDKASANAKSNGTTYDDEWDAILESNDVESADELTEKFIYEKEKEVMKNWYADNTENAEALKNEFLGVDATGAEVESDVKAAMPYHIRHILVKVDETSDTQEKFYKGTITETQAKLLSDTVTTLAKGGYTFSQVAGMYSEDGSASSGGDVGIMTNAATSGSLGMVNEFQLGLYAYDNLYDDDNIASPAASVIKKGLGISDTVATKLNNIGLVEVPYEAFVKLGKYADVTADNKGNKLANGSSTVYPRNILWNKYLNLHNVFVITDRVSGNSLFGQANAPEEFSDLVGAGKYSDAHPQEVLTNFDAATGYLTDGNGHIIIGVRSQYGIHFMIIEKSMYEYATLADYYSTKIPGETGYDPESYVGFVESPKTEDYKKRADDVKSKITSFDATYEYRLYEYLQTKVTVSFEGAAKNLDKKIDSYIEKAKESNAYKQEDGLEKVWKTYTRLLDAQAEDRNAIFNTIDAKGNDQNNLTRLASEQIADDFINLYEGNGTAADYANFAEGGDYYYYA